MAIPMGGPSVEQIEPLLFPSANNDDQEAIQPSPQRKATIAALCVVILAAVDSGLVEVLVALVRIYEDIVCSNYYAIHDPSIISPGGHPPEAMCKIEPVQSELAFIRGFEGVFSTLPSLLLAAPYGLLADKVGRRPVMLMSVAGLLATTTSILVICRFPQVFPLRLVWLCWAFTLIGGGAPVGLTMIMTMMSDIVEASQRATTFFRITVGLLIAQVCATSLAATIITYGSPWLACSLGYLSIIVASCFTLILPETMLHKQGDPHRNSDFPSNDHRNSWDGLSALPPQDPKTSSGGGQAYLHEGSRLLSDSFGFLFHDRKTSLILFTFFANTIGNAVLSVGVQYISTRFYVTIAEANLLFSLRAAFNAILFIFILPSILYLLRKKSKSKSLHTLTPTPTTAHQDLLLAQLSVVFLPLGYFFMALASNIPLMTTGMLIMTLGTGHASLMRALVTELFEERHIARLYAAITIFETLGSILSGPLLAGLLSWGLQMQGVAMGMPFFAAAGMTLLVAVLTWRVRIPLKRRQCERGEESDEEVEEEEERAEEAEGR